MNTAKKALAAAALVLAMASCSSYDYDEPYYSDRECESAAKSSNRANGFDVDSEYEACLKIKDLFNE